MVVINLTLFIQLGLFLVFLWITNRFFLRPILALMDERNRRLAEEGAQKETDDGEASTLEQKCQRAVELTKREIHESIETRKHKAQAQRLDALTEHRRVLDREVLSVRDSAAMLAERERAEFPRLAPEIAEAIGAVLRKGGKSS